MANTGVRVHLGKGHWRDEAVQRSGPDNARCLALKSLNVNSGPIKF